MKDLSMEQITQQYFDVLKELGNIGAGNATTALAQLINCKVDMKVPQVRLLNFNELGALLGGEETILVSIYLQVEGDVEGSMMFVLSEDSALHLVNKLMSGMLGVPEKPIEECHFGENGMFRNEGSGKYYYGCLSECLIFLNQYEDFSIGSTAWN